MRYFGRDTAVIKRILNCAHVRLETSDLRQLKRNFLTKPTGIILHDYNLNTESSYEILKDLQNSRYYVNEPDRVRPYPIGNKFPIQIYKPIELIQWNSFVTIPNALALQYNGFMDDDSLKLLTENKKLSSQLYYHVTYGSRNEQEFFWKLEELFKQTTYLRRHNTPVIITYDYEILPTKEIRMFLDLLNYWMRYKWHEGFDQGYQTLTIFCKLLTTKGTKINKFKLDNCLNFKQISQVYSFIKEHNPKLYSKFYDTESAVYDESKGGIIYDWRRN